MDTDKISPPLSQGRLEQGLASHGVRDATWATSSPNTEIHPGVSPFLS